nr:uncharacterized protein CTRU02_14340 [Colletotrichum truncatum]KAF6782301.1 hypothetical protein CTRU02_14340 [Colletotrichum truncatum]
MLNAAQEGVETSLLHHQGYGRVFVMARVKVHVNADKFAPSCQGFWAFSSSRMTALTARSQKVSWIVLWGKGPNNGFRTSSGIPQF